MQRKFSNQLSVFSFKQYMSFNNVFAWVNPHTILYVYNTIIVQRYIQVYMYIYGIYIQGISCKCCDYITNSSNANSEKSRRRYKAFSSNTPILNFFFFCEQIRLKIYYNFAMRLVVHFAWVFSVCKGRLGLDFGDFGGLGSLVFIIQRYAF